MGGALSTEARLADVVCGAGELPGESMVRELRGKIAGRVARGEGVAGGGSISRQVATVRSGDAVRLHVYRCRGAAGNWELVEKGSPGAVFAAGGAEGDQRAAFS